MATTYDESLWVTRVQAGTLCGCGPQNFDDIVRRRLPEDASRGSNRTLRFYAPSVVSAFVRYKLESARPVPAGEDAMLADGSDSPNLERYRLAKAIEVERKNDKEEGLLIPRPVIREALLPAAAAMRQAGERLAKLFGNDAHAIYAEAVQEYEAAISRLAGAT